MFGANFGLENTFRLAAHVGNPEYPTPLHPASPARTAKARRARCSKAFITRLDCASDCSPRRASCFVSRTGSRSTGKLISKADVVRLVGELRESLERRPPSRLDLKATPDTPETALSVPSGGQPSQPTLFEFAIVMARSNISREQNCDLVIWETGLGGRKLDATNIVTPPAVSVITNIQFDHQQWLGDTLGKIAAGKGRASSSREFPSSLRPTSRLALAAIKQIAREKNCAAG